MPETKPLPKYLCHKEVHALKIARVDRRDGHYFLVFEEPDYPPLQVTALWVDRFGPTRGQYFVQYRDGYTSVSPAKAFEEGYQLVREG